MTGGLYAIALAACWLFLLWLCFRTEPVEAGDVSRDSNDLVRWPASVNRPYADTEPGQSDAVHPAVSGGLPRKPISPFGLHRGYADEPEIGRDDITPRERIARHPQKVR